MNIPVYIGRRLSFNARSADGSAGTRPSAGVPIAVGGIALALVIMMVSIAVMMGFKDEIRAKLAGFNSQITVYPQSRSLVDISSIDLDDDLREQIAVAAPEASIDGVVELPGILKTDSAFQGIMVKALEPGSAGLRFIDDNMVSGRLPQAVEATDSTGIPAPPEIVISATTAAALGLGEGERVDIHFISSGTLKTRRAVISGIYDTHMDDYDSRFIYATPSMTRSVGRIPEGHVTAIELNGISDDEIESLSAGLSAKLLTYSLSNNDAGRETFFAVDNLHRSGQAYFAWLDLLDTNVAVILILMSLVSGFTLISSLFILILERVNTIGILKALGATNGQIRGIFIYMAERLVTRGLVIGNVIGLGLLFLQHYLHIIPLDAKAYFLSYVPVTISWPAIIVLNIAVAAISAVILIIPSHMVATLSPASSIRYE